MFSLLILMMMIYKEGRKKCKLKGIVEGEKVVNFKEQDIVQGGGDDEIYQDSDNLDSPNIEWR